MMSNMTQKPTKFRVGSTSGNKKQVTALAAPQISSSGNSNPKPRPPGRSLRRGLQRSAVYAANGLALPVKTSNASHRHVSPADDSDQWNLVKIATAHPVTGREAKQVAIQGGAYDMALAGHEARDADSWIPVPARRARKSALSTNANTGSPKSQQTIRRETPRPRFAQGGKGRVKPSVPGYSSQGTSQESSRRPHPSHDPTTRHGQANHLGNGKTPLKRLGLQGRAPRGWETRKPIECELRLPSCGPKPASEPVKAHEETRGTYTGITKDARSRATGPQPIKYAILTAGSTKPGDRADPGLVYDTRAHVEAGDIYAGVEGVEGRGRNVAATRAKSKPPTPGSPRSQTRPSLCPAPPPAPEFQSQS